MHKSGDTSRRRRKKWALWPIWGNMYIGRTKPSPPTPQAIRLAETHANPPFCPSAARGGTPAPPPPSLPGEDATSPGDKSALFLRAPHKVSSALCPYTLFFLFARVLLYMVLSIGAVHNFVKGSGVLFL